MLESLFNKVTGLKACNFIEKETQHGFFSYEYRKIFTDFCGTPLVADSENEFLI